MILVAGSLSLPAPAPLSATEAEAELYFRVEAEVRGFSLDADVRAGGRLAMRRNAGGTQLSLIAPLEDPWKLYWVDPVGPVGEEVKVASVITLEQPTWEALEEARGRAERFGAARYAEWQGGDSSRRAFDGAFAFVALGPPRDRFEVRFRESGEVLAVDNRLTARWLSGPLDPYLAGWSEASNGAGEPPEGYWFWNQGEAEPFVYEPHTYHALVAALRLLELPLAPEDSDQEEVAWDDLAARTVGVLETLAPKARGRIPVPTGIRALSRVDRSKDELRLRVEPQRVGGVEIEAERIRQGISGRGVPHRDHFEVRLRARRSRLVVVVGIEPAGTLDRKEN